MYSPFRNAAQPIVGAVKGTSGVEASIRGLARASTVVQRIDQRAATSEVHEGAKASRDEHVGHRERRAVRQRDVPSHWQTRQQHAGTQYESEQQRWPLQSRANDDDPFYERSRPTNQSLYHWSFHTPTARPEYLVNS